MQNARPVKLVISRIYLDDVAGRYFDLSDKQFVAGCMVAGGAYAVTSDGEVRVVGT